MTKRPSAGTPSLHHFLSGCWTALSGNSVIISAANRDEKNMFSPSPTLTSLTVKLLLGKFTGFCVPPRPLPPHWVIDLVLACWEPIEAGWFQDGPSLSVSLLEGCCLLVCFVCTLFSSALVHVVEHLRRVQHRTYFISCMFIFLTL